MTCLTERLRSCIADACFIVLALSVWAVEALLAALGLVLASVLLATGFDAEALFSQLGNLSHHYLIAAPSSRAHFSGGAIGLFAGLVTLAALVRLPSLVTHLRAELGEGKRHG